MKIAVFTALLLVNVAFATQSFLGSSTPINPVVLTQFQQIESSSFGKNLLDTVALQVKNQAPLADVSKLLSDLKKDLQKQQADADTLQTERRADCKKTIAEFNRRIEFAQSEIKDATAQISKLEKIIADLKVKITGLESQLKNFREQKSNAIAAREKAAREFADRVTQHDTAISALEDILEELNRVGNAPEFDQTQALIQLGRLGANNPIAAFAQVALTLPAEDWQRVKDKIAQIRDSLVASKADDANQEKENIEKHEEFLIHINAAIAKTEKELKDTKLELGENESALENQQTRLKNNQTELQQATQGRDAKQTQCNGWEKQYAEDTEQRRDEIAVVEKVQEIFAKRIASAKDYLKNRIDQE